MYCDILNTFYLKPNGQIPCNDDIGEIVTLGVIPEEGEWSPDAFFQGEQFQRLRDAGAQNRMPWGDTCRQCALLQPRKFEDGLARRSIEKFQVETSTRCTLQCPECSRIAQLKFRSGRRVMKLAFFEHVLAAFSREGYEIRVVEYCGQGEPLSNAQFSEFVSAVRRYFPKTSQRLVTNGNYDYLASLKDEWIEELIVSCDGAYQASYEQYRIGGNIEQVFHFMRDAVKHAPRTRVIWKYILFEYNDSDEEILLAQKLARELGVADLRFVLTGTRQRSRRYHTGNVDQLPRSGVGISIAPHPVLTRMDQAARGAVRNVESRLQVVIHRLARVRAVRTVSQHLSWLRTAGPWQRLMSPRSFGCVDYLGSTIDRDMRYLVVEGWILWVGRKRINRLECVINSETKAKTATWIRRPDVIETFPHYEQQSSCGFRFIAPMSERLPPMVDLEIRAVSGFGATSVLRGTYSVSSLAGDFIKSSPNADKQTFGIGVEILHRMHRS